MNFSDHEQDKTLFEVKEFLVSIIGNAPYGIIAFDLEGEIILTNSFAIDYLGKKMSVNSTIEKDIMELIGDIPTLKIAIENNMRKGREKFDLLAVKIKNKFILFKGRSILNGTLLLMEDITELKKAENELAKQSKELSEANLKLKDLDRMKSMFIASMSHELRTPLNSIIGFTGLILQGISGTIDKDARDDLNIVYNSSKHLLSLINDVIDISKIEADKFDVYFEEVKLDEVFEEVVANVSKSAEKNGIEIKTHIQKGLTIIGDKRRLFQCILNLMSNAVKFTEKGFVELKAVEKADVLKITITDTGRGIKKENISKLFKSFVRIESPMLRVVPGTGLGLYLTEKIMNNVFNGSISVASEFGKGSAFTLNIPLKHKIKRN